MIILQGRLVRVAAAAVAIIALFSSGSARASVIYDYVGNNFVSAFSPITTSDQITGFVEFATAPTSGETDKSDVSAFSFTAGPLTIDNTTDLNSGFSFNFDSSLNVVNWNAAVIGLGGSIADPRFRICNASGSQIILSIFLACDTTTLLDEVVFSVGGGSFGGGSNSSPGVWTPSPVPLPAALPLFLSALAGLGLMGWRRRTA